MLSMLEHSVLPFLQHYSNYAGWIAFFAAFLETMIGAGYFLPGSTILLIMGIFAGQGIVSFKIIFIFALIGTFVGGQINYFLGKKYGTTLLKKPWIHLPQSIIKKAEYFVDHYGSISVFFGRFLPGIKESISFMAGSLKMRYGKFTFWNTLGAIGWCFEFVGVGYIFSTSLSVAQLWLTRSVYVLIVLMLFFIIIYLLIYFLKKNTSNILTALKSAKNHILTNKNISKWITSHPKTIKFIKRRANTRNFFGLPLTALISSFLYILALFGGAIEDFLSKDSIITVDHIVANIIPSLRTPLLNKIFTYITLLGKTEVVIVFFILSCTFLFINNKKRYIMPWAITIVGSGVFIYLGKIAFHRPRPNIALYIEPTFSFPSGHATISIALYGFVAYLLVHFSKNIKTKLNIIFIATIFILLIGMSRVYLGEHYLSDVYSGYLLGTLWLIVGIAFTNYEEQKNKVAIARKKHYTKIFNATLIASFLIFFIVFSQLFHYRKNHISYTKYYITKNIKQVIQNADYFTQSLLGLNAWPINIVFISKSTDNLLQALKKSKYYPAKNSILKFLPIYWKYKGSLFSLKNKNFLLKIWKTNFISPSKKHIFVATVIKIDSYQWSIIPKFSKNLTNARNYIYNSLKKRGEILKSITVQLRQPFFAFDILNDKYFSDGKYDIIYLKE